MNVQSLGRPTLAYLLFLAFCIPVAVSIGGPIQVFCAGAILFFFPGYFTSLALLAKQSVAGRVGTAIGFSFVLLAVLEVVYTTLLIPGDFLTIVGPLFLWTTLMFVFSLALKRDAALIDFNSFLKPGTIVIVAMLLFGALTRIWYPLTVGTTPYLSLIHISEPTRLLSISYAVFCLKKKKKN